MRFPRILRSTTALGMIALLGAIATGLPSHSHERRGSDDRVADLVSADHHEHGTRLVEQDQRAPSHGPWVAAAVAASAPEPPVSITSAPARARREPIRPTGRAPPPRLPRAPPRLA